MNEDLIAFFEELIRCYKIVNTPSQTASGKEITYWRERFLSTANLPEDPKRGATIWANFIYRPTEPFVFDKQTPEEMIEEYKKYL